MRQPRLSLIAALGRNRCIGAGGKLPWRLPEDLARFKALTLGHPVIMGRKTWESLPEKFRPLPGRQNLVVTRNGGYAASGGEVVYSLEEALAKARTEDENTGELFVIGGAELYAQALPLAGRLYLTLVDDAPEGDAFFPPYEKLFTKKISEESGEHEGLRYRWVTLERASP